MRHLHFTQSLEPLEGGGLGRAALDLHLQLLHDGFASRLVSTRSASFDGVWPEAVQYLRLGPQKAFFATSLGRDASSMVAQADVVHGHGFYVYPNWAIGAETRKLSKPLVYHPHGMFEPWILQRSRLKKQVVSLLFENQNMNHCRFWRALSHKEADQIRGQGFKAPIVVAPNGVRLEEIDATPSPATNGHVRLPERAQNRKRLVFMARLHPKKGLDLLLPAWSKLGAARKEWELLIAGPDEGGYRATVEKMLRDLDLATSVSLLGTVTGHSKLELLRGADLFVLPSYSEGLPVAVLEAMACRLMVVATRESNIPELETEGGGWLCDATCESVKDVLERALQTSDTEREMRGAVARALVERRYTWPVVASAVQEACKQYCS